jgi:hypothetical protein
MKEAGNTNHLNFTFCNQTRKPELVSGTTGLSSTLSTRAVGALVNAINVFLFFITLHWILSQVIA